MMHDPHKIDAYAILMTNNLIIIWIIYARKAYQNRAICGGLDYTLFIPNR